MYRFLSVILSLSLLSGCSSFFRDRTLDYKMAESRPALAMPEGVDTRPIQPLWPIPSIAEPATVDKQLLDDDGVPLPPKSIVESDKVATTLPALEQAVSGRLVVKLGTDGNGIPELRVLGPRDRVWDELAQALEAAKVSIKDKNLALGLIDVEISGNPYQVRMVRGAQAYIVTVQKSDDVLAPLNLSRNLLTILQARWP
jgi:uncharacterized lipoprotein